MRRPAALLLRAGGAALVALAAAASRNAASPPGAPGRPAAGLPFAPQPAAAAGLNNDFACKFSPWLDVQRALLAYIRDASSRNQAMKRLLTYTHLALDGGGEE